MSKLTFRNLKILVKNMENHNASKDKFSFTYKFKFDVIVAIVESGYELLIGIHSINFGFVVKVNERFVAELKSSDYFALCDHLELSNNKQGFNSNIFLNLLSSKIPLNYSGYKYTYKDMIPFLKCKFIDESEKIYFKG